MDYEVIFSDRKTMALQLKPDGTPLVRAPRRTSRRCVERFLREHWDWVERQREKQAAQPRAEQMDEAALAALKKQARPVFLARTAYFAPLVGVRVGRISVRSQRSKWGSCSSKGNLNFNCLLLLAPPAVLDYVVVHELCHRLELNHSPRFWAELRRVLPDYEAARRWLRQNGGALMARLPD
jgi:predicted metal-dependent hydrolase